MPVEQITLTGEATRGIGPQVREIAFLPATVCLGRKPPTKIISASSPELGKFFNPKAPPPPAVDYRTKAAASIARMYLNDRYGDCVIAGKAHALGIWSANDTDSGGIVLATDNEIYSQYQSICGPGDNGCVITDVLDTMAATGFLAGGKRYKIDAYVGADWTNKTLVQAAQYVFGASSIGIDLPQAWTNSAIWDVTNSSIVGGHDVTPIDYDQNGVYVASWGRIYQMTWAAFLSKRWIGEYWILLAPLWYNNDKLAPSGYDTVGLKAALEMVGRGQIPPIPEPTPPPPPPPIPPPVPPPVPVPPSPPIPPAPPGPTTTTIKIDATITMVTRPAPP